MFKNRKGYIFTYVKDVKYDIYVFEKDYVVKVFTENKSAYIDMSYKGRYIETKSFDTIKKINTILNIMDRYTVDKWYLCSIGKRFSFYVNLFEHLGYTVINKKHYIILKKN